MPVSEAEKNAEHNTNKPKMRKRVLVEISSKSNVPVGLIEAI
jgi:hypothetical protein